MFSFRSAITALASGLLVASGSLTYAATDGNSFTITIKDHRFKPQSVTVPAGKEFDLVVVNEDPTAEEFESNDFHVEKMVAGGKQITLHVGPLSAGSYGFFGDRHKETALGNLFAE
ncbi:cupredoxin domain-containing protein [Aminobacter sp. AP02]|uniref:cupredoxin domain-containing protein n=1 Tax=Aminobacter sp. AP02 TaxID=2135737 RepID=UPI000D6AB37F|nr:cupredoxin domain-containing protein [Aminobacter sp. AP02]PWK67577.1 Cupredoxin-like domain-containing protein [Aminobacter sp. AP02]